MSIEKLFKIDKPFNPIEILNKDEVWKILIVSDEEKLHKISAIVFNDFRFHGKKVEFINAYSYYTGVKEITNNSDIAVVIIDIMIEDEILGLKLVKYIRKYLNNKYTRIILQSNTSEELRKKDIILNYDINDYKGKDELTSLNLFTGIVTALRGYKDITIIEENRKLLKKIMEISNKLYSLGSEEEFVSTLLFEMISILNMADNNKENCSRGFIIGKKKYQNNFKIVDSTYAFEHYLDKDIKVLSNSKILEYINIVAEQQYSLFEENVFVLYLDNQNEKKHIIYIDTEVDISIFDRELVRLFYNNVVMAFENLKLYNEIEDTQREIIYTLGEVAEARSESEIGNHVKRVAMYSELLAHKLGLSREEVKVVKMASPIHDVGKIAIPDNILLKPGKLTVSEFEYMKKHSELGYEMLKKSNREVLKAAAIIAYQHHEKYDGTGYPQRLKGEDIHIYGRITGIADVFDALLSRRVYKNPWKVEDVIDLMKKEKGKHFDPILVDILLENIDEMLEIYENYGD